MSKYTVVIPRVQSTKKEFSSLRSAKAYARSLPRGQCIDDLAIVTDGYPGRYMRIGENGRFSYACAPESWKNA